MTNPTVIQMIALDRLESDPRNANVCDADTLKKLKANIQRSGLCPALVVRPHPKKKDRFILVDGHHRMQVAQELGWQEIPCQIWDITDSDAQLLLATLNRLRGEDNPRKRAELLDGLAQHFDASELLDLIPESKGELAELLALLDLDESEMQAKLREAIKKDEAELPVILSFVLKKPEAEQVQATLARFQPEGNEDPSAALMALCEAINAGEKGRGG